MGGRGRKEVTVTRRRGKPEMHARDRVAIPEAPRGREGCPGQMARQGKNGLFSEDGR